MIRSLKTIMVGTAIFVLSLIGYIPFGESGYAQLVQVKVREVHLTQDLPIDGVLYHKNQSLWSAIDFYNYSVVNTGFGESFMLDSKYLKPCISESRVQNLSSKHLKPYTATIPENIVTQFNSDGWRFEATKDDLTSLYGSESSSKKVTGATLYKDKCIKLKDQSDTLGATVCHEIGHYIDKISGEFESDSDIWLRIYEKEKDNAEFLSSSKDYAISTPREYFAECVNQTILYPWLISEKMPMSYHYCLAYIHSL